MSDSKTSIQERKTQASTQPKAVAFAQAHEEAWSHHDYETARKMLAPDVHVQVITTTAGIPATDTTGADAYMEGLVKFADAVKPGSLKVNSAIGDDRNALVSVSVQASDPMFGPTWIHGSRQYLIDDNGKLAHEQVIFHVVPDRK